MDLAKARMVANDATIRQVIVLTKNGVPFDVAVSLDDETRFGWFVICCELDGASWDWVAMRWREPKS